MFVKMYTTRKKFSTMCVYKRLHQQYLPICTQHAITMFSKMYTKMGNNGFQQYLLKI